MDCLLERHRLMLPQIRHRIYSTRDLIQFFDDLVSFLNTNVVNRLDCYRLLTTICFDHSGLYVLGPLNHPKILKHSFFALLSRTFDMLFTKSNHLWLTTEENQCLDAISLFITNLCLHKNEILTNFYIGNNEKFDLKNSSKWISYERIFFTETFRLKFRSMLETDLSKSELNAPDDLKYQIANRFLRLWMKLNQFDVQWVLNGIIQCLKSEIYLNVAQDIDLRRSRIAPKEMFFLYHCPKFLRTMFPNDQEKISRLLCEHFIDNSEKIFDKQLPIVCEGDFVDDKIPRGAKIQSMTWYLELLNSFALIPSSRFYFLKNASREFDPLHDQKKMIDQIIEVIKTESLIKSVRINQSFYHCDVSSVGYCLVLLYNLIFEAKIFSHLKEKRLVEVLEKLRQAKDRTIEFTSGALVAFLNREKIDEIQNPTKLARSYLFMIENTVDELSHVFHGIKLETVLTDLEKVVQNDEVKEEIVNDDGLNLLGQCSLREDLDFSTTRYPALRIIETISFASEAPKKLIANERLVDHLNDLDRANDQIQTPLAKRILWLAEKEEKFIEQQEQKKIKEQKIREDLPMKKEFNEKKAVYQYIPGDYHFPLDRRVAVRKCDLVISYAPSDRIIAQKIQEQLKSRDRYEVVALEADDSDPEFMAQSIENAPIVIICCSLEYRNSNASRLQAKFAEKRDRKLLGLKVDRKYEINGWLEEVLKETELLDFTKTDLNNSMKELEDQIDFLTQKK